MRILALDPGTTTGWAWAYTDQTFYASGVQTFKVLVNDHPGLRFLRYREFLLKLLRECEPARLVYEQAFVMPRGNTTAIFFGLIAMIQAVTAEHMIECRTVNALTLKKWTAGSGRSPKAQMLDAVVKRWGTLSLPHLHDCAATVSRTKDVKQLQCANPVHDEADAVALLHYAKEHP